MASPSSYGCSLSSSRALSTSTRILALNPRRQNVSANAQGFRCVLVTTVKEPSEPRAAKRRVGSGTKLIGCGSAVPKQVIHNDDLSKFLDTSNEWILPRTGIEQRRVLSGEETLKGLAVDACKRALEMAKVEPEDLDLILFCTSSAEDTFGGAPEIQRELSCSNALAFDLTAACSGFVVGLVTATRYIKGGGYKTALVVGADALSRYVDWSDRSTCILFGDGAGAVVLQACSEDEDSLLGFDMHTDGSGQKHLHARIEPAEDAKILHNGNGSTTISTPARPPSYQCVQMNGREVFRFAVRSVPQVVEAALQEAGLENHHIDWLLLHQANQRIIDAVSERLAISQERVLSNLVNYGNTSAASIPLALDEAVRSGKVKRGDVIASAGFGAGLTWASAIFKWG
ncbi:hypothetical protein SELMODRAFT_181394 [Selaginella moellendorffii]|uniref:beta-ketoacyl-[acyl-carrier-protein] synthase III n=1 Tax=Selaginella moellendorffii TaxID=88036 RepID=D8SNT2_SELML|nr:3-oxoacyl-[acyl-carrier-protein] synthase III, chloroplastic [Selaginella moellendorffii]XP_002986157.1 3-oxoacyl-[acyl-carrier-protein] synthase III, chloroplastic [Selaginella moellendorffii]EFJ12688.1 hypothetical protein SELMODRAFT_271840 [Selaginella moellendorffii]EFJ13846.1 hypothetical protein SELMODRAFT_181394 [Selaginella moellendorffii]|eukprot:XP_002984971.1 3-oxoacyl-[acyl-carrier-protein] synthase III, chloroplastic [Selaginella moellendorffii]